jgi:hypothetical protein
MRTLLADASGGRLVFIPIKQVQVRTALALLRRGLVELIYREGKPFVRATTRGNMYAESSGLKEIPN